METIYLVRGCGISAIGPLDEGMLWILNQIIAKGEWPLVEEYKGESDANQSH